MGKAAVRSETTIAALALLWLSVGCAGPACTEASLCDIRTRSCQQETMETVACMRGRDAVKLPEVRVVSESKLQELLDEDRAASSEDDRSEEERAAEYSHWSRGLSLLGLSPADYARSNADSDTVSEYAAVYRPSKKQILIVDRGKPSNDRRAVEILAHETVHAMQDAELDLKAYQKRWISSYDDRLAVTAIIEGEAVLYELLVLTSLDGRVLEQLNWRGFFEEWRSDALREADEDEAPIAMGSVRFPYAFGGGYVFQHWYDRGRVGVDQLFEQPPRSTAEVMFGTSQPAVLNARESLLENALPALGENYQTVAWMTSGAWIARQYAVRSGVRNDILASARVLLGDVLSIHYNADTDHVITAWKIRTANDQQRAPWLPSSSNSSAFAGWRPDANQTAYTLVGEPPMQDDAHVVLVNKSDLQWNAPPRNDAAEEEENARVSPSRHAYVANRPRPAYAQPNAP